ncbi:hypothetical protein [Lysinibacillus telephonicus]|uniref:Uncharacterized protein n=1 Tax=Lysinibacillus telephonicus TaxID=1714840 RepID=A0A431URG4_9BACI|nr:hypothetical protein [Lysinibacillus telephonicus]RTQ92858.1 hypothetical protein EKG35_10590 [Lysinibacillus telephonicus]
MNYNNKALKILLNYSLLNPEKTLEEDFQYAKTAGYMFDKIEQTHNEAIENAITELKQCSKRFTVDLFLASLSNQHLDWRSGLPVYVIMKQFPIHDFKSDFISCEICGNNPDSLVDLTFVNKIRFGIGGIISGNIYDFSFILQQHNKLPHVKPTKKDFDIFKFIIEIIRNAETNDTPSKVQKKIGKIKGFKSNEEQRKALLETLGFCSILETEEHKGFLHQFINLGLAPRSRHSSDWLYPVDWWKGKDGINEDALKYWFGEYEELQDLFM